MLEVLEVAHYCTGLHWTQPYIIIHPLSLYDLNNVEREIKHQTIIIIIIKSYGCAINRLPVDCFVFSLCDCLTVYHTVFFFFFFFVESGRHSGIDIFSYFSLKTYVVGTPLKCLTEACLMSTHMFLWRNRKNIYLILPLI